MKIKTTLFYLIIFVVIVSLSSCGDDEETPVTLPVVTTDMTITTTTTTAMVSGAVTDNGNAPITEAGFVYSSNVDLPTTSENKVESVDKEELSAELIGLVSGTTYNLRAYAINEKGTAYGEKRTFQTGNAAPVASNVQVTGTPQVAQTLTAAYTFTDAESDDEGESLYKWYAANDAAGTGESQINGASEQTLVIGDELQGKFIRFGVTPVAATGTTSGLEVKSDFTTAVGAETVTFTYNNQSVTYGVIKSTLTQRKWLDRNLGATRAAQSVTDYLAYGDLFQWGRLADGHQLLTRADGTDAGITPVVAGVSTTRSDIDVPATNQFITTTSLRGDWRNPQNHDLWKGVNGTNNPCPSGWRIATEAEWTAEGITNITDGYSKLKLTYTGWRDYTDQAFKSTATWGYYWSTTTILDASSGIEIGYSKQITFNPSTFSTQVNNRANGYACRCTKD